ncbi:hypothetical protein AB205_0062700, partial [Aquarana catesbeiana]
MCPQWSPSLHQVPPTESLHTSGAPSGVPRTLGVPRQRGPSYIRCPQALQSLLHQVPTLESLLHQVSPDSRGPLTSVSPVESLLHQCPQAVESLLTSVSTVESLLHQVSPSSGVPLTSVSPVESLLHQVSPVESLFTSGVPRQWSPPIARDFFLHIAIQISLHSQTFPLHNQAISPIARHTPSIARHSPLITKHYPFIARHCPFIARPSPFVARHSPFVARHWLCLSSAAGQGTR